MCLPCESLTETTSFIQDSHIMIIALVFAISAFSSKFGKCAPPRTPENLQKSIDSIIQAVNLQAAQMETLQNAVLNNVEPKISQISTNLASLTSDTHNLQERSHVWDTFQLYIASWNDQMSTADRKLDIISKGQEKLFALETKLNQLTSSGSDYKLDLALKQLDRQEDALKATFKRMQEKPNGSCCLFGEFASMGALSSLKIVQNKLDVLIGNNNNNNYNDNNNNTNETLIYDTLTDVASKVDVIFDKLNKEENDDYYLEQPGSKNKMLKEILTKVETESNKSIEIVGEKLDRFNEQRAGKNCKRKQVNNYCATYPGGVSGIYGKLYCEIVDGQIWTLIQRRDNYVDGENFSRPWMDYKNGFGRVEKDFWLGNDAVRDLSKSGAQLRVELQDFEGNAAWAQYDFFTVGDEGQDYILQISGYSGNASDSFSSHNGSRFSTYDRKNDEAPACCPCAASYGGGWWFNSCFEANLNGVYITIPSVGDNNFMGIIWETWLGDYSLKRTSMMIRPIDTNINSSIYEELIKAEITTLEIPYYEDP